jgi:hypothetical protein
MNSMNRMENKRYYCLEEITVRITLFLDIYYTLYLGNIYGLFGSTYCLYSRVKGLQCSEAEVSMSSDV